MKGYVREKHPKHPQDGKDRDDVCHKSGDDKRKDWQAKQHLGSAVDKGGQSEKPLSFKERQKDWAMKEAHMSPMAALKASNQGLHSVASSLDIRR